MNDDKSRLDKYPDEISYNELLECFDIVFFNEKLIGNTRKTKSITALILSVCFDCFSAKKEGIYQQWLTSRKNFARSNRTADDEDLPPGCDTKFVLECQFISTNRKSFTDSKIGEKITTIQLRYVPQITKASLEKLDLLYEKNQENWLIDLILLIKSFDELIITDRIPINEFDEKKGKKYSTYVAKNPTDLKIKKINIC